MTIAPLLLVGKQRIILNRYSADKFVNGRKVVGDKEEIPIYANIQPTKKWNDMMQLPEGERTRPTVKIYTTFPVRMRREGDDGWAPDTFNWPVDGNTYQVRAVYAWQMGVLNHYKAICVRVEVT